MKFFKAVMLAVVTVWGGMSSAQTLSSTYTNSGLGEIFSQGLQHNFGMGDVGIGTPSYVHINLKNPSLLVNNRLTSFQVGLSTDFRSSDNAFGTTNQSSVGMRYLALAFPVVRNTWSTSLAMLPLSTVSYRTVSYDTVDVDVPVGTQLRGDGGLNRLIWANGFKVYKNLAVGLKADYIFGGIEKQAQIVLFPDSLLVNTPLSYQEVESYSSLNWGVSVSNQFKLGTDRYLILGATYDHGVMLDGERASGLERTALIDLSGSLSDTTSVAYDYPAVYGFGLAYQRLNQLSLGVDIIFQPWESTSNTEVRNTLNVSAGGSYIPDYQSVNKYLARVRYRMGIHLKQLPYVVDKTSINDFGINFGASFPVSGYSTMDVAFKLGQRGTLVNDLVRERYLQVVLGATINDRWFIKRRYD